MAARVGTGLLACVELSRVVEQLMYHTVALLLLDTSQHDSVVRVARRG